MTTTSGDAEDALARTALLVKLDLFPQLSEFQIVNGLRDMHVRLRADAENLTCPAAQTAVVATAIVLVQSGVTVTLDMPDVALLSPQPPLANDGLGLAARLKTHLTSLPAQRHARSSPDQTDLVVVIGDTTTSVSEHPLTSLIWATGDDWSMEMAAGNPDLVRRWSGDQPFGAVLCACAVGAEVFRAAMRKLARRHKIEPLTGHRLAAADRVQLAVAPIAGARRARPRADVVSAGAITNSAMFTLQRVPEFSAALRVFDDDAIVISNLNRYPMLTLKDVGVSKVQALASTAPPTWIVEPTARRFDAAALETALPLAPYILVGVDDIPSRWLVQRHAPKWLCVAGTSHFEVVVSEHVPGGPCAGCMHPHDDPGGDPIPTVSFVSMLAGVLQAHRFIARLTGQSPAPAMVAWALGLDGPHGLLSIGESARAECPVCCAASAPLRCRL